MKSKLSLIINSPLESFKILLNKIRIIFITKNYIGIDSNRSDSDDGLYIKFVKDAVSNYKKFKNFKRNPDYNSILEHTKLEEGSKYLDLIKSQSPNLLNYITDFKFNDKIGNPRKFKYADIGEISPSTLRYMKVASDFQKYFGNDIGQDIVEIGCGYGGQLLILDKVFNINNYVLMDLQPVLDLASMYLDGHVLNASYKTKTINRLSKDYNFDLVISNYAFSELPKLLQIKYIEKVLSKSKKGYLTMNSGKVEGNIIDRLTIKELQNLLPRFDIIEEIPLTAPNNYIIIWGHNK